MSLLAYIILFSLVGGVFSLIGGLILINSVRLINRLSIHILTFAAGALLAAALLDILPEVANDNNRPESVFGGVLFGMVLLFVLERVAFQFHHHDERRSITPVTAWLVTIGDSIHNLIDGVAIATAFIVNPSMGIITALAVTAHEVPHEIGDFAIMAAAGWTKKRVVVTNIASALLATLGAVMTYFLRSQVKQVAAIVLSITAGIFIYIALSDLLPEINTKTRRDKAWHVLILFIAGIVTVEIVARLTERLISPN